jgi:hypothetical protein
MMKLKSKMGSKLMVEGKSEKFSLFFLTFSVKSFIINHKNVNDNIFREIL